MNTPIRWLRRFPDSGNNFDLVLTSPRELDSARMNDLLDSIEAEEYRNLTSVLVLPKSFGGGSTKRRLSSRVRRTSYLATGSSFF